MEQEGAESNKLLPQGIKSLIYSYSDMISLLEIVSKLSKTDRNCILTTHSRLLT